MPLADDILIRRAHIDEILDLRHLVLRYGLARETARFDGDAEPTTLHIAAIDGVQVVGCATFMLNQWDDTPAWQLRGMAVTSDCRSGGIGTRVLSFAEQEALQAHPTGLLWANARAPAMRFYLRHGWERASELFEVPTAGPHYKIVKRISSNTA